ncbi:DUF3630 family protein [Rheinheimera sp.]|jgi:hypothetical protein|uniref:DUF3630 family protein n=1 Tax=Rheinheimera sp. TaxID=1869214 RepID=UPI002603C6A9|nr:DUF3630 family protein [Rheinheimera sp.]MCA1930400.1 DUF3630 family protein [Rheinheimera sp.]
MNHSVINSFIVQTEQKQLLLTPLWPMRFEQVQECKNWFIQTAIQTGTLAYGADRVELGLSFANESFTFCYEDYSESFWVTADSAGSAMLLSELANEFSTLRIK